MHTYRRSVFVNMYTEKVLKLPELKIVNNDVEAEFELELGINPSNDSDFQNRDIKQDINDGLNEINDMYSDQLTYQMNAELELLRMLADYEDDVQNGRIGSCEQSVDILRESLVNRENKKYGAKTNPIKRLGLHAHVLSFIHQRTGKLKTFKCPASKTFWQRSAQK